jgi:SNF2 family DNA or RNA helicase
MDSGRLGLLPPDAFERFGWLRLGTLDKQQRLRFARSQAGLLDLLIGERGDIAIDPGFRSLREQLRAFERPVPIESPAGFGAKLRPYQAEGLGWLEALYGLGLGGCLADDMGLGKTVQVLAALEHRRQTRQSAVSNDGGLVAESAAPSATERSQKRISKGRQAREARPGGSEGSPVTAADPRLPSLVVAPRSVLFNWIAEARRFAPNLVVAEHHGPQRWSSFATTRQADLIVTSYATLRQDIETFSGLELDRVVLDEAQAIKNRESLTAKAVKCLRARQRLALTGTPVENRVADLWSIFDFLNPGLLGGVSAFEELLNVDGDRESQAEAQGQAGLAAIGRAVRPFFLRRTKSQVLKDLPEKTEQTLWVELGGEQRRAYNELLAETRGKLLGKKVAPKDEGQHRLAILTALLRLRQCALHPGLLPDGPAEAAAAKFDELLERLATAVEEGHKALVFSQFTGLLALLKPKLEAAGLDFAYLDGETRDREAVVNAFQAAHGPPLCLLSLKAGGSGLNLMAADYVFLLDPWWNPAVEAQAIGRAHRLGQKRAVTAYRLVARNTIEERILELQAQKSELAEALFDESNASIGNLSREDLEALLA